MKPTTFLTALSASRLVLTPLVAFAVVTGRYWAALILCLAGGITDALDGYLARRWKATSNLGANLDAIGDKALVSVTYLSLGWADDVPWLLVALVFGRDLMILSGAAALSRFARVSEFRHSTWGKIATQIHVVTLGVVMLNGAMPGPTLARLASGLIWLAGAGTVISGVDYAIRGVRLAEAQRD
jgi:cardiolipin synthase